VENFMPGSPLISVIVAVLNNDREIKRCLDSVSRQHYRNIELIVIDGGSNDGTVDILANYSGINYWESAPDRNIAQAWNRALKKTNGEWLYFLGSDDYLWSEEVLDQCVDYLKQVTPVHKVVYGQVCILNEKGLILKLDGEPWNIAKEKFIKYMSLPHQGVFHHRSIFKDYGPFDEEFKIASDYELLMRVLITEEAYYMPGLIVAGMSYGGLSTDRHYTRLQLKESLKARRKHGIKLYSWYWIKGYFMASLWIILVWLIGEGAVEKASYLRKIIINRFSIIRGVHR
jgi:glycosyltransferase involved in cell wall biosynthesis